MLAFVCLHVCGIYRCKKLHTLHFAFLSWFILYIILRSFFTLTFCLRCVFCWQWKCYIHAFLYSYCLFVSYYIFSSTSYSREILQWQRPEFVISWGGNRYKVFFQSITWCRHINIFLNVKRRGSSTVDIRISMKIRVSSFCVILGVNINIMDLLHECIIYICNHVLFCFTPMYMYFDTKINSIKPSF